MMEVSGGLLLLKYNHCYIVRPSDGDSKLYNEIDEKKPYMERVNKLYYVFFLLS